MVTNSHPGPDSGHEAETSIGVLNGFLGASSAIATEEMIGTALGGPLGGIAAAAVGAGVVYALDHTNIERTITDFLSPAPRPLSDCVVVPSPLEYLTGHATVVPDLGTVTPPFSPYGMETSSGFDEIPANPLPAVLDPLQGTLESPIDSLVAHYAHPPGLIIDPADGPEADGRDFV